MNRFEFISKLKSKLSNFPEVEVNDRVSFYTEMINDYLDNGLSEEEAVLKLGSIDEIAETIAEDIPLSKLAKKKLNNRNKLSTLNIVFLIIGFPLWFSLLAAGFAVIISVYAALWSVVISLWAVVVSCGATSLASLLLFMIYLSEGNSALAFGLLGTSLMLLGISGLFLLLSNYLTKFAIKVPKLLFKWIKRLYIVKEVQDEENN